MKKNEEKAVVLGKASFIDFEEFALWCGTEEADDFFSVKNLWTDNLYELQGKIPGVDVSNLFDKSKKQDCYGYITDNRERHYIEPLKKYVDYINAFGSPSQPLYFSLLFEHPSFDIISFADNQFLIPKGFLDKTLYKDYTTLPINTLRAQINAGANYGLQSSLIPADGLSAVSLNSQHSRIEQTKNQLATLNTEIDDVHHAKKGELADLQAEIDRQMAVLQAKKEAMLAVLEAKKAEMELVKEKLERELFMLESEIYSIRCFLGEVVDFIQIRSGKSSPSNQPITLFQKVRFLDEELGKAISFYDFDFEDIKLFENLLKARDDAVEIFCPNDKCVSLVRVSKTGDAFRYRSTPYGEMLEEYEVYHGKTIGILIRNGENLYLGWTDEEKINIPEDMFYVPGSKVVSSEDAEKIKASPIKEMVSRYFIFAILQGALENQQMLSLPENVTAQFTKPSPYILYSAADAWITDNKYGTFRDIVEKVNSKISVGDSILALEHLSDGHTCHGWGGGYTRDFERDHNFSKRTHDVKFKEGQIYKINLIEDDSYSNLTYYVSLVKDGWDHVYKNGRYVPRQRDAYARFRVFTDEFINLTYLNSVWIKYAITTQNLGYSGRKGSFAEFIRFLNKALEFVREREKTEFELISKYIPNIADDSEWPVKLSEWKLANNVRSITDYQAKRFAKMY